MPARIAIYLIPVGAVIATAAVLLGPGTLRPVVGVRVRGVPADGAGELALRLEGVRRHYAIDDAVPLDRLSVEATGTGGETARWEGATGPDGIAEALLRSSAGWRGPVLVRVRRDAQLLAEGRVDLPEREAVVARQALLVGTATGDLRIEVEAVRGKLAAPFADPLRFRVSAPPHPATSLAGIVLELAAPGAELGEARLTTDARGTATVAIEPLHHQIELTVSARDVVGRTGRWEGFLPVVPGAMWLDPAGPKLRLVSPAPRDRAYVSLHGDRGRRMGAVVALAPDGAGFHAGTLDLEIPASGHLHAIVAGDPFEQGAGTVAWPLRPPEGLLAVRPVELLLDGVPGAEEREAARAWAARRIGLILVAAAALAEILLLVTQSRRSRRRLEEHLRAASAVGTGSDDALTEEDRAQLLGAARERSPILRVVLMVSLVALGFALIAALARFR